MRNNSSKIVSFHKIFYLISAKFVQNKAVLFTNDVPDSLHCGKINNVLAGLDFGPTDNSTVDKNWEKLRKFQQKGPKFVAEFYTGKFSCISKDYK